MMTAALETPPLATTPTTPAPAERDARMRADLLALFQAAVSAVSAEACMPGALPGASGRTLVVAVGKAAGPMARIAAARTPGEVSGLVILPHGHGDADAPVGFETIEAGHPTPDSASLRAAECALASARALGARDRLLMLVSGGGSALMAAPADGVSLADKQALTRALLRSGATIAEINAVRTRLSRIKGGRLAAAASPAAVTTLVISDVPGDDPALVASGPTLASAATREAADGILGAYGIEAPTSVLTALARGGDRVAAPEGEVTVIARARDALDAAAALARSLGCTVADLGDGLQAEARELGAEHAVLARRRAGHGGRHALLSGGETTVTVRASRGRGGRNLEYLLGLAIALDGRAGVWAIACDTDGIDGTQDNAGAVVAPDTLVRALALGLDPAEHLAANDSYAFFAALNDLVVTGPTRTNVNDFRAILIDS